MAVYTLPLVGMHWIVLPDWPHNFPRPSRCPSGFASGNHEVVQPNTSLLSAVHGYNAPKPICSAVQCRFCTPILIVATKETHATQFKTTHAKHANHRNETHVRAYPLGITHVPRRACLKNKDTLNGTCTPPNGGWKSDRRCRGPATFYSSLTTTNWEDGFSGYELTFESRISGTVTQSLLSHLRNEAITLWNCCWQTMRGLWLNEKPVLAAPPTVTAAAAGKTHKKWSCCLKPVLDNRYSGQSRLLFNY